MNKGAGGKAIYRSSGSLAFVAAARAAFLVAPDPDDSDRRLLLPIKNNLAPDVPGLAYRVTAGKVVWDKEPVSITANEVLAAEEQDAASREDQEDAKQWLERALADGGLKSADVLEQARQNGYSRGQVGRAKRSLGVKSLRVGLLGPGGHWEWRLPASKTTVPV